MSLRKEIFYHFKLMQLVYLATSQNNRPFVRPMILIYHADQFWLATGTEDTKVGQISSNDLVEFCYPLEEEGKNGYIRGNGHALFETSDENRKMIFDIARYIQNYWDTHSHPGFTLFKLDLKELDYMRPGESTTSILEL